MVRNCSSTAGLLALASHSGPSRCPLNSKSCRCSLAGIADVERHTYVAVPLEHAIDQLPDLWHQCDSLSMWTAGFGTGPGAGKCWLMFRHFLPHWDAAVAVSGHTPLDGSTLGETGSLLTDQIHRYCTDVCCGLFAPSSCIRTTTHAHCPLPTTRLPPPARSSRQCCSRPPASSHGIAA